VGSAAAGSGARGDRASNDEVTIRWMRIRKFTETAIFLNNRHFDFYLLPFATDPVKIIEPLQGFTKRTYTRKDVYGDAPL
ncbi:MAG: hypothetical protein AAFV72_22215, partial [Cyanobacteria bacterium J06635_1]